MSQHPITRNGVRWYEIPPDAKGSSCRDCGVLIYWITSNGKRLPIDPNVDGGYSAKPTADGKYTRPGFGALHLQVCSKRFKR